MIDDNNNNSFNNLSNKNYIYKKFIRDNNDSQAIPGRVPCSEGFMFTYMITTTSSTTLTIATLITTTTNIITITTTSTTSAKILGQYQAGSHEVKGLSPSNYYNNFNSNINNM